MKRRRRKQSIGLGKDLQALARASFIFGRGAAKLAQRGYVEAKRRKGRGGGARVFITGSIYK